MAGIGGGHVLSEEFFGDELLNLEKLIDVLKEAVARKESDGFLNRWLEALVGDSLGRGGVVGGLLGKVSLH